MLLRWITRRFWPRIWATANKWLEDDGPTWAASLGYYAAFSFFPLVLLLISVTGYLLTFSHQAQLEQDKIINKLIEVIGQQTSKELAQQAGNLLNSWLNGVKSNASVSGPVGLVTLLFAAIGIFTQLEAAFGRIWHVEADPNRKTGIWAVVRNVLFVRFRAFLMLLATGALVLLAFIASLVVSAIGHHAQEVPLGKTLLRLVSIGVGASLNTLCFTLLYRLLPKRPVLWRHAVAGALVAGIAWEIGRQLLSLFLIGGSYTAYGIVGSLIVLMLWCNYGSMVLLFGAEYVEITGRLAANRRAAATALPNRRNARSKHLCSLPSFRDKGAGRHWSLPRSIWAVLPTFPAGKCQFRPSAAASFQCRPFFVFSGSPCGEGWGGGSPERAPDEPGRLCRT